MLGVRRIFSVTTQSTRSRGGNSLGIASSVPNSISTTSLNGLAMHISRNPASRWAGDSAMSSTTP